MTCASDSLTVLPALPEARARAFLAFACELADAAAAVTLPLFLQPPPVEAKADATPVTIADRAAEMAMRELIDARHPSHAVAGEEFGGGMDDSEAAGQEFVWVLDPIDGTRGFISGSPLFATLIALLHRGAPVLGVLDFPALGERVTGVATRDYRAARLQKAGGGSALAVAGAVPPLARAVAVSTTAGLVGGADEARWRGFYERCGYVRLGGDAQAYRCVAAGAAHIALDCDMQAHDYLPLLPVLAAAGGIMSDWDGRALAPYAAGKRTVLACASEGLWREAVAALGR